MEYVAEIVLFFDKRSICIQYKQRKQYKQWIFESICDLCACANMTNPVDYECAVKRKIEKKKIGKKTA